jgi:hypothetical protein
MFVSTHVLLKVPGWEIKMKALVIGCRVLPVHTCQRTPAQHLSSQLPLWSSITNIVCRSKFCTRRRERAGQGEVSVRDRQVAKLRSIPFGALACSDGT